MPYHPCVRSHFIHRTSSNPRAELNNCLRSPDELRNRGITIVRLIYCEEKSPRATRRAGDYLSFGLNVTFGESRAVAAPTCFPREEALGFYVDDRSRTPHHYSSYGTPATSDSESSVTGLTSIPLKSRDRRACRAACRLEPNNNIRNCPLLWWQMNQTR